MSIFGRRSRDTPPSTNPFLPPAREAAQGAPEQPAEPAAPVEPAVNPYLQYAASPPSVDPRDNPFVTTAPDLDAPVLESADADSTDASGLSSGVRSVGRPSRGDAKRTHRVGVSLNAVELAAWEAEAAADGVGSVARWARDRVMSSLALEMMGHSNLGGEVAGLRADLNRVGNNLNQIARALNVAERGGPDAPTAGEVLEVVEATRRELAAIRAWTRSHS